MPSPGSSPFAWPAAAPYARQQPFSSAAVASPWQRVGSGRKRPRRPVAAAWEDHRSALLLFGAADALRELVGTAMLWPADIAAVERSLAMLRGVLGEARVKSILGEGRKVPLQEAVAVAARDIRPPTTTSAGDRSPDAFTRRERDVLALLAANQMDQEIAAALFLSPRTVNWHVRSILAKLGVSSRREAVVRARAAGLV